MAGAPATSAASLTGGRRVATVRGAGARPLAAAAQRLEGQPPSPSSSRGSSIATATVTTTTARCGQEANRRYKYESPKSATGSVESVEAGTKAGTEESTGAGAGGEARTEAGVGGGRGRVSSGTQWGWR